MVNCGACGIPLTDDNWWSASRNPGGNNRRSLRCKECASKAWRAKRVKHMDTIQSYRKRYKKENPEYVKEERKRWYYRKYPEIRAAVLTHYGGNPPKCACCGESIFRFLSLDHIDGGGNADRRSGRGRGWNFYRKLINLGYPDGFQVLCMNCNWGRYNNGGICPHKEVPLSETTQSPSA